MQSLAPFLGPNQFGCRPGRSTTHTLIAVLHNWMENLTREVPFVPSSLTTERPLILSTIIQEYYGKLKKYNRLTEISMIWYNQSFPGLLGVMYFRSEFQPLGQVKLKMVSSDARYKDAEHCLNCRGLGRLISSALCLTFYQTASIVYRGRPVLPLQSLRYRHCQYWNTGAEYAGPDNDGPK